MKMCYFCYAVVVIVNIYYVTSQQCYYCSHSQEPLATKSMKNLACLRQEKFSTNPTTRRVCAKGENQCMVEVMNRNGQFQSVRRDCTSDCRTSRLEKGFGLFDVIIKKCCTGNFCNLWDSKEFYLNNSERRKYSVLSKIIVMFSLLLL